MEKRIMIVDDDPDLLVILRALFEKEHFEVLTVDTGYDCLKELQRGFSGVILMDLMMPFMDGYTTIHEIVKQGYAKLVKIVIITASSKKDQDKYNELEPYIYDYIQKPFNIDWLLTNVKLACID